jgi:hypothetical protein
MPVSRPTSFYWVQDSQEPVDIESTDLPEVREWEHLNENDKCETQ